MANLLPCTTCGGFAAHNTGCPQAMDPDDKPVLMGEHNRLPPRYSPDLCNECQSPISHHRISCSHFPGAIIGVDPAAGPDHTKLVFVDKTDGKNLSPGAAVKIGKIEALRIQSPPQLFSTINQNVPINICFHDGNEEVGEFLYDKGNKRWTFKGNMDEAAKLFAKFLYSHFQSLIEGDRDHLLDDAITDMYGGKDEEESEPEKVWPTITPGEIQIDKPHPYRKY